jgi:hypothetical protein
MSLYAAVGLLDSVHGQLAPKLEQMALQLPNTQEKKPLQLTGKLVSLRMKPNQNSVP